MNVTHVYEIERDSARQLTTALRRSLAQVLIQDPRVTGAWLAIENEGVKQATRLERLQVSVVASSESGVDQVLLPLITTFGKRHRMRLYWSESASPKPDRYPRDIMERLRLPYSWNRYVTLGEVFKLPPRVATAPG